MHAPSRSPEAGGDSERLKAGTQPPHPIEIEGLGKRYGAHTALIDLNLTVRSGEVFGFIGPNGAGKTTTIRILLDLVRPSGGSAQLFGLDCRRQGIEVRRRIGYLPGELSLYEDMTPRAMLGHLCALRGGSGAGRIEPLAERLELELDKPIHSLSKGNKQKVGLVQAFMHKPQLLILDEPTSGVDPLIQREFQAMVQEARENGQTLFVSSHVLSEIERIADRVGMIRNGRLAAVDEIGALKSKTARQVEMRFAQPVGAEAFEGLQGVREVSIDGHLGRFLVVGSMDGLIKAAARYEVLTLTSHEPDLEELFLTIYGGGGEDARIAGQEPAR